jgi:S-adenosylmethionine:tRNA ribosyltransferase-isomerase
MERKEFLYDLPPSLIAANPVPERSDSRLMVIDRRCGSISHQSFSDLVSILRAGDLLVLNDTRVLPARFKGTKETGGAVEVLLVEPFPNFPELWIALVDSSKKTLPGSRITFSRTVSAEVIGDMGKGRCGLKFRYPGEFADVLAQLGETPLPPYIERRRELKSIDRERYQTVYARNPGSVAAPTAGLHFTRQMLEDLGSKGVKSAFLTLHVGPGTFRTVHQEVIELHHMEGEWYRVDPIAAGRVACAKRRGGRVIAVGSTTTRTLEWVAQKMGKIAPDEGIARLYIYPGYCFSAIDGLLTNFHLPGSTPLILVAAFAGLDLVRKAYEEAIRREYRFYSYGDAMLIV